MSLRTSLTRTVSQSALLAALLTGPALADVTGPEVWEDWKTYMRDFGYEVSGTETQSGDRLTISDLSMDVDLPEGEGTFSIAFDSLVFVDQSDGSVVVEMPQTIPMRFNVTPADDDPAKGTVSMTQTAPSLVVSGDAANMVYTYGAETLAMVLTELEVDGTPVTTDEVQLEATLGNVASVTTTTTADLRAYTQELSAASLGYLFAFVVPEEDGGGDGRITGSMQTISASGSGTTPGLGESDNMDAMLAAGLSGAGSFSYARGNSEVALNTPDGPVMGTTTSEGGEIAVSLDASALSYDVTQTNLKVEMQSMPDVPFPVSLAMARSAFNLKMPLRSGDAAQDFAFGFTLGDFTVNDTIWNLFDPAGQLPRDPATLALSLTGTAKVLVNLMDPAQSAALEGGAAPGELETLNIETLQISAAGAEVTGMGGFTFDNTDTTTFPGFPRPEGTVDVRVEGANALIDTLVRMGLLPEDQAMGARMMMGLFGVPQGDDVLTSKIEANEQGHVLANGQRLQ